MGLERRTYHSTPHCTIHSTTTDSYRRCTNPWYFNPKSPAYARGHVQRGIMNAVGVARSGYVGLCDLGVACSSRFLSVSH